VKDDDRPLFEKPLNQLLPPLPRREAADTARHGDNSRRSPEELVAIARLQKRLILVVLLSLLSGFLLGCLMTLAAASGGDESVTTALVLGSYLLVILPLQIVLFVTWLLLSVKLFRPTTVALLVVLIFACGLGVVSVLVTVVRATAVLREYGIRVGLLGARKADLPRVT
jgi:hypothetical protein